MTIRPRPRVPFDYFAAKYLGIKLYDWQMRLLIALEHKRVSAVVCNGGGKSSVIISSAVLAFLYNWPRGRVLITAGTFSQIRNAVWPAIERHSNLPFFKGWHWSRERIDTPEGGFCEGFSTDKPTNVEGQHEELPDSPFFFIVDEAKAVEDAIYKHINRTTPTFYMQVSSAGPAQGYFYHSFTTYKSVFWTIRVTSHECPHVTDEQRALDRVLLDPKDYAMRHESEFSDDLTGAVISMSVINKALERQRALHHQRSVRCAFCDFALNGAENVLALRDGNKVDIVAAWRESDTTQSRRQFIEHFKRLNLHHSEIFGDAGGPGYVIIREMKEDGWPINEINNSSAAEDDVHYSNRGAEIWFQAARIIEHGENGVPVIIPTDKLFIEQATNRKRELDGKQRLRLQSKDAMAALGIRSPDRADAVFGALVCKAIGWNRQQVAQVHLPTNMFASGHVRF
jgi:hypothetical protein